MWQDKRIIDLTLTFQDGMRGVSFETACTVKEHGWNATNYHLYSHAGTHLDAPIHYGVNEKTVVDIPLERCMCEAWVADLGEVAPKALIGLNDLGDIPKKIQPGQGLLLKTGWSARVEEETYRNALPRVSEELALWCASRKLPMLGVEPPAVADPFNREEITHIHQILLKADVVIVEGLCNLEALTQPKVMFFALPIKVPGDGAPVRAFAMED